MYACEPQIRCVYRSKRIGTKQENKQGIRKGKRAKEALKTEIRSSVYMDL